MNKQKKTEVIKIKKLKKDGTIDQEIIELMLSVYKIGGSILIPVDCMYGLIMAPELFEKLHAEKNKVMDYSGEASTLISNFKMADIYAEVGKHEFDFLHKVWPGEINISMKKKDSSSSIILRMPKCRYMHDFINRTENPVMFMPAVSIKKRIFRENEIIKTFSGIADLIVIIKEFCKDHIPPSLVDISGGTLNILKEGRVQSEDIKSLYFLDNM